MLKIKYQNKRNNKNVPDENAEETKRGSTKIVHLLMSNEN